MISSMGMETFEARLQSFSAVHASNKKRNSNSKGAGKLKWPHKSPAPAQVNNSVLRIMDGHSLILFSWPEQAFSTNQHLQNLTIQRVTCVIAISAVGRKMTTRLVNTSTSRQVVAGQPLYALSRTSKKADWSKKTPWMKTC